ncbi:hypothetical protein DE146DRAFT_357680 [Phaeosphaeria sp. MPI-PUGE-AT-0046c]|nr:hypothetical protein DE146DRAFT_357680 [Phaeosphaeria sp. MPI-PUGE-AT-0046c]
MPFVARYNISRLLGHLLVLCIMCLSKARRKEHAATCFGYPSGETHRPCLHHFGNRKRKHIGDTEREEPPDLRIYAGSAHCTRSLATSRPCRYGKFRDF